VTPTVSRCAFYLLSLIAPGKAWLYPFRDLAKGQPLQAALGVAIPPKIYQRGPTESGSVQVQAANAPRYVAST